MYPFSIGVMLDSFRTDVNTALEKAQSLGAQGIQVYATAVTVAHEMTLSVVVSSSGGKDHWPVISALCGDLGQGFGDPEKNPALIEESKRILI